MENTRPSIAGLIFVWITAVNEAKYNDPITPSNAVNTTNQTKALGDSRPDAVNPAPKRIYVRLISVILLILYCLILPPIGPRLPKWLQSDSFGKHLPKSDLGSLKGKVR